MTHINDDGMCMCLYSKWFELLSKLEFLVASWQWGRGGRLFGQREGLRCHSKSCSSSLLCLRRSKNKSWGTNNLVLEQLLYLFLRTPYDVYFQLDPDGGISPVADNRSFMFFGGEMQSVGSNVTHVWSVILCSYMVTSPLSRSWWNLGESSYSSVLALFFHSSDSVGLFLWFLDLSRCWRGTVWANANPYHPTDIWCFSEVPWWLMWIVLVQEPEQKRFCSCKTNFQLV